MTANVLGRKVYLHEIDESTIRFVNGKGLTGKCKHCGTKVVLERRHSVTPRRKPKMSKKERRSYRESTRKI